MLDTISTLNAFAKEAGITEVHLLPLHPRAFVNAFLAKLDEFLRHRW